MKYLKATLLSMAVGTLSPVLPASAHPVDAGAPAQAPGGGDMQGMKEMPGMGKGRSDSFWFGHPAANGARVDSTVTINATDLKFSPMAIVVKVGQTIAFKIVNSGKVRHELVLGDDQEQADHEKEMASMPSMKMDDPNGVAVEPGKTATLIWTFIKAGKLKFACHEPGHFAAGMTGDIFVE